MDQRVEDQNEREGEGTKWPSEGAEHTAFVKERVGETELEFVENLVTQLRDFRHVDLCDGDEGQPFLTHGGFALGAYRAVRDAVFDYLEAIADLYKGTDRMESAWNANRFRIVDFNETLPLLEADRPIGDPSISHWMDEE